MEETLPKRTLKGAEKDQKRTKKDQKRTKIGSKRPTKRTKKWSEKGKNGTPKVRISFDQEFILRVNLNENERENCTFSNWQCNKIKSQLTNVFSMNFKIGPCESERREFDAVFSIDFLDSFWSIFWSHFKSLMKPFMSKKYQFLHITFG